MEILHFALLWRMEGRNGLKRTRGTPFFRFSPVEVFVGHRRLMLSNAGIEAAVHLVLLAVVAPLEPDRGPRNQWECNSEDDQHDDPFLDIPSAPHVIPPPAIDTHIVILPPRCRRVGAHPNAVQRVGPDAAGIARSRRD